MSQPNTFTNPSVHSPQPIEVPCNATCINLQVMHKQVRERLGLQYHKIYLITRYEIDPTPEHLGAWVQLAYRDGFPTEWVPAHFFSINWVMWPN